MNITVLLIIVGVIVVGAVVLVIVGLRDQDSRVDPLQDRLNEFVSSGELASLEEI